MELSAYRKVVAEIGPPPHESIWDGSVDEVAAFIKEQAHDPKSFEWVQTYRFEVTKYQGLRCWRIPFRFRAKNGFGGLTLHTADAYWFNGRVVGFKER